MTITLAAVYAPIGFQGGLTGALFREFAFTLAGAVFISGVVALSGFVYTKKNKILIFSVLVNNHQATASAVRKAVEKFITGLRESY